MKTCPFCGQDDLGIGRVISTVGREGWHTYIYCATCGARGPWIYTRNECVWESTDIACEETGWNERVKEARA